MTLHNKIQFEIKLWTVPLFCSFLSTVSLKKWFLQNEEKKSFYSNFLDIMETKLCFLSKKNLICFLLIKSCRLIFPHWKQNDTSKNNNQMRTAKNDT
jgi:hypothetical protein